MVCEGVQCKVQVVCEECVPAGMASSGMPCMAIRVLNHQGDAFVHGQVAARAAKLKAMASDPKQILLEAMAKMQAKRSLEPSMNVFSGADRRPSSALVSSRPSSSYSISVHEL